MHRASDNGVISGMYSMVLTDARQDLICDKGPPARSAYRWTHANDLETIMSRANRFTVSLLIGVAIAVMIGLADAQPRQPARGPAVESGGMIYGSQLMTPAERTEYRTRMLAAASDVEREKIRAEHHAEMQKRAKARGIKLPDAPPHARHASRARNGDGHGPRLHAWLAQRTCERRCWAVIARFAASGHKRVEPICLQPFSCAPRNAVTLARRLSHAYDGPSA